MRRVLVYVGGWLLAVVVATAIGFAAIGLVGGDVGGPVSGIAVVSASTPSVSPSPGTTRTGDASSGGGTSGSVALPPAATQVTDAGAVTARCRAGARLVTWSPQNGWSVRSIVKVDPTRQVVFTDGTNDVTVDVHCVAGGPVFAVSTAPATPTPTPTETPTSTPTPTDSVAPGGGT